MQVLLPLSHGYTIASGPTRIRFLVACLNNERWAQKLYETYYSTLIVVAQRYANNDEDALDILHEGFIKNL